MNFDMSASEARSHVTRALEAALAELQKPNHPNSGLIDEARILPSEETQYPSSVVFEARRGGMAHEMASYSFRKKEYVTYSEDELTAAFLETVRGSC